MRRKRSFICATRKFLDLDSFKGKSSKKLLREDKEFEEKRDNPSEGEDEEEIVEDKGGEVVVGGKVSAKHL